MKWTTDKPTEPGWYWIDDGDGWDFSVVKVSLNYKQDLFVSSIYNEDNEAVPINEFDYVTRWAGPIPEPEDE